MVTLNDVFAGTTYASRYTLRWVVTQDIQDIPNNRSRVEAVLTVIETTENGSWSNAPLTFSGAVNGQTFSGSKTFDFGNYDSLVLWSGAFWVNHNSDGTKTTNISAQAGGGTTIGSASVSGTLTLSTIARASVATFSPDNQLDPLVGVTIAMNSASSGFTHNITYELGALSNQTAGITTPTGVINSTTFTPPISLLNQIKNATSLVGEITVKTYSGGNLIGTTTTAFRLHVPADVVPDFTTITHADTVAAPRDIIGAYVQNASKLSLAITGAVGAYGSTIKTYKIEVDGVVVAAASGTMPSPLPLAGTAALSTARVIKGTITDSRGRTKTKTVNIDVLAYVPPKFNSAPSVQRALSTGVVNNDGTYFRVNIDAVIAGLTVSSVQKNQLTTRISVRTKKPAGTPWVSGDIVQTTAVSVGTLTFNSFRTVGTFSPLLAYDVLIEVIDKLATSAVQFNVPVAGIFMHWDAGLGVGFGKYRENGMIDVLGDIWLTGRLVGPHHAFAEAEGNVAISNSIAPGDFIDYTITFPSGRFTQPPNVWFQTNSVRYSCGIAANPTTTGVTVRVFNPTGSAASNGTPLRWYASQMTSASANG